jgi:hypothetical protein
MTAAFIKQHKIAVSLCVFLLAAGAVAGFRFYEEARRPKETEEPASGAKTSDNADGAAKGAAKGEVVKIEKKEVAPPAPQLVETAPPALPVSGPQKRRDAITGVHTRTFPVADAPKTRSGSPGEERGGKSHGAEDGETDANAGAFSPFAPPDGGHGSHSRNGAAGRGQGNWSPWDILRKNSQKTGSGGHQNLRLVISVGNDTGEIGRDKDGKKASSGAIITEHTPIAMQSGMGMGGLLGGGGSKSAGAVLAAPKDIAAQVGADNVRFAPYGRMVKCTLLSTLESFAVPCPLVGRIEEPVYWRGRLILPAGTEVHGTIASANVGGKAGDRARFYSGREWTLVLPRQTEGRGADIVGMELRVSGMMFNADTDEAQLVSGLADWSPGIVAEVIRSNNMDDISLFASTFLSAVAEGLQERQSTAGYGGTASLVANTPQNAALHGTAEVLNEYAKRVLAEINANGAYARVAGGKRFYLYVQQTILPDEADIPQPDKIRPNKDATAREAEYEANVRERTGANESPFSSIVKQVQKAVAQPPPAPAPEVPK